MTYQEFQGQVAGRRSNTGENYSTAVKNLLEYMKTSGMISESQYQEFKQRAAKGH